jgi:hypothetical protein
MKTAALPPPLAEHYQTLFDDWAYCQRGDEGIKALIEVFDQCVIGPQIGMSLCRITLGQRVRVKLKAVELLMAREPPEIVVGRVVWRTDGKRLWTELAR